MPRYALKIEYDGGPFMGWQWQDHGPSVQGAIEEAIFKTTGEKTLVYSAGRTDAGVHAEGQVANVVLEREFTPDRLVSAINGNLWRDNYGPVASDFRLWIAGVSNVGPITAGPWAGLVEYRVRLLAT